MPGTDKPMPAGDGRPAALRTYLTLLRKRWLSISLCAGLASAAAGGLALTEAPVYEAHTQVFVSASGNGDVNDLAQGSSFTERRVQSYTDLVTTSRVLKPVSEKLRVSTPELRQWISATVPTRTVIIQIKVTHHDSRLAANTAKDVANSLIKIVDEIERPHGKGETPVHLSVVESPERPTVPVSPTPKRDALLGLLGGAAAGVGLAALREQLNTRIRTQHDLADITDVPVLGVIERAEAEAENVVLRDEDAFSPRAECYRQLRTNLLFTGLDQKTRSITVTSSVPGEGKTTTAANLAVMCAEGGSRVLLVDADLRRPKLAEYLGLEGSIGLTTVLTGRISLSNAVQPWGPSGNMEVLASGWIPPNPSELLASGVMRDFIRELEDSYDIVIFDAPPLVPVTDPAVLGTATSGVLLVVGANGRLHRNQLNTALDHLESVGARLVGLALNGVKPNRRAYSYHSYGPTEPAETPQGKRAVRRKPSGRHSARREEPGWAHPADASGEVSEQRGHVPDPSPGQHRMPGRPGVPGQHRMPGQPGVPGQHRVMEQPRLMEQPRVMEQPQVMGNPLTYIDNLRAPGM
ncbi:polysaccharide biosynthesis tyrosine autokinase [Streptomyces pathocidini]|uniref:polysaccharide biosynthesis tyrosine autokinase n=1 Tax=Streptomyces pathocidini TaxID=1650571 RepID=UPI0033EB5BE2